MVARIFRLVDTKRIEMKLRDVPMDLDNVLVQPDFLSICAADERYYFGKRKREVLWEKLPMALIHEAVGTILFDGGGVLKPGDKVLLVPLEVGREAHSQKGNYRTDSIFVSSNSDGFMRDLIALPRHRVIPIKNNYNISYALCEILSVALGAVDEFEKTRSLPAESFGIWGDGSMGFVAGLALREKYPNAKIYIFGKTARKLNKFSFTTEMYFFDRIPEDLKLNHAFECVGGMGSEHAINQIVDLISPQGTISLLGVSEESIPINTRKILEKGLTLIGNSRSDYNDFAEAVKLIGEKPEINRYLRTLISEVVEVRTEDDISYAFEQSVLNDFKTVMRWSM